MVCRCVFVCTTLRRDVERASQSSSSSSRHITAIKKSTGRSVLPTIQRPLYCVNVNDGCIKGSGWKTFCVPSSGLFPREFLIMYIIAEGYDR